MENLLNTLTKKDLDNLVTKSIRKEISALAEPKKFLTSKQVLDYLHICKVTLYKYEKLGKIKPKTFGKKKLYDIHELDTFISTGIKS